MKMLKTFAIVVGVLILFLVAVLVLGPVQKIRWEMVENPARELQIGQVNSYLAKREGAFVDIKKGQQKQVIWAGAPEEKTSISIVYVHGFSASMGEIRPVPDQLAKALGANLFYTRLAGHGRSGAAMGDVHVQDWVADLEEALSIGKLIGDKVIVMGTSNGATLASLIVENPNLQEQVAGLIFVSPNFKVKNGAAFLGKLAFFDTWGPMIAGPVREWEPHNELHGEFWTTSYPTKSIVPMMRLIDHVEGIDFSKANLPVIFADSPNDLVSDQKATAEIIASWPVAKFEYVPELTERDDPYHHVIAGDALSPEQNAPMVTQLCQGLAALEIANCDQ